MGSPFVPPSPQIMPPLTSVAECAVRGGGAWPPIHSGLSCQASIQSSSNSITPNSISEAESSKISVDPETPFGKDPPNTKTKPLLCSGPESEGGTKVAECQARA